VAEASSQSNGNVTKVRIHPENHSWAWTIPTLFSQGWKVGNWIFVGGQVSADENGQVVGVGDIEVQTRNVFANIRSVLNDAGAEMRDIVKLNTYYVFKGTDDELTGFWEAMTRIRMEYLGNPGPASTAVQVPGFGWPGLLIEAEAIAYVDGD
jgi:2-iminobutanoate/2-iminopropanoate deaminase